MTKKPTKAEIELRRWCIEQAVRWPWQSFSSIAGAYVGAGIPPQYRPPEQPNIIQRADEIYKWVNKNG